MGLRDDPWWICSGNPYYSGTCKSALVGGTIALHNKENNRFVKFLGGWVPQDHDDILVESLLNLDARHIQDYNMYIICVYIIINVGMLRIRQLSISHLLYNVIMLYRTSIGELTISYLCDANYPTFGFIWITAKTTTKRPHRWCKPVGGGKSRMAKAVVGANAPDPTKMAPTNHGTSRIEVT